MTPDVIHRQLTMYGCWTFNPQLMAECARFAVDRNVPLGRVFTDTFTLDQADDAYQRVEARRWARASSSFEPTLGPGPVDLARDQLAVDAVDPDRLTRRRAPAAR